MTRRLLAACVLAAPLFAQTTGTIGGTARDASGGVVPGAAVAAVHLGTNQSRALTTDSAGEYAPFLQQGITVQANSQVQVNATLRVRAGAEQVTVSDSASLVQSNSTTLVQVIDAPAFSSAARVLQFVESC